MGRDNSRIARRTRGFSWILLVGILSLAAGLRLDSQTLVIRVKVTAANVRSAPQFTGAVLTAVPLDMKLEVIRKSGDWYQVSVLVGNKTADGFIHKSVVEEVALPSQAPKSEPVPAATAPTKAPPQTPPARPADTVQVPLAAPADKDQAQMAGLEAKIKRESAALLTLARTMKPQETESQGTRQVKTAKIITARCQVLETNLPGARVIHASMIGEEFAVLGQNDAFVKIRLRDGREGWITETCLQLFSKTETFKKVVYTGIEGADKGNFIKVAEGIFSKLVQQKLFADEIAGSYARRQDVLAQEKARMAAASDRILSYFDPAAKFYNQYIGGQNVSVVESKSLAESLSGWANILLGTANYGNNFLNGASSKENGMSLNLDMGGSLAVNPTSQVELNLSQSSDVIETPYSSTTVGAGYSFRGGDRMNARAGASYNAYSDTGSPGNSYGRLSLNGGGEYRLSEKADLNLDYQFVNHAYSEVGNEGYSSHQIRLGGLVRPSPASRINFGLRANLESSKSDFHDFLNLEPAVTYEKIGDNSRFGLNGRMELFSFGGASTNNFTRTQVGLTSERAGSNRLAAFDARLALKSYSNSPTNSYLQLRLKYSSSSSANGDRTFAATATTDLYTQASDLSFTDLRLDHGSESRTLFYGIGLYSRLWHKPAWGTFASKPFVLDFLGKLGINLKYFRIGPTLGIHALISSEKGVKLLARNGNVFRLGAVVEGEIPLPRGGRLNLSAWYEYGFVYENSLSSFGGDLIQRHPTNLQLRSDVSLPVLSNLEVVGQIEVFRIATDMDKTYGGNPLTSNTKLKIIGGIRYRYN